MSDAFEFFDAVNPVRKHTVTVDLDSFTEAAAAAFDFPFTGTTTFSAWPLPSLPKDFGIGAIVGPSGTGKSLLLSEFGKPAVHEWDANKAIVSQVASTPTEAIEILSSVGLNTIPSWLKPFHVLSLGEQFRANLARGIQNGAVFDEFTSVVDRHTAMSAAKSMRRFVDQRAFQGIVVATCHEDVLPWLEPDWVFHTDTGNLSVGRSLPRPSLDIDIYPCGVELWSLFAPHHYLTADINPVARCFVAIWGKVLVGFWSTLALPSGTLKNAWRGHRTVILPAFQGMGIGTRFADRMAHWWCQTHNARFFSRTAHPRFIRYRDASPLWRNTMHSKQKRNSSENSSGYMPFDSLRVCASHEYVGFNPEPTSVEEDGGVFDLFGDG
jgi:energy-coupling factor transporter ATP-binding protein EcfA2